jgi:hypothetical protein
VVDLASVRAVARDRAGREVPLIAFDPRGELGPHTLNAMWFGRAAIAYRGDDVPIDSICVDVGGIDRSAVATERWLCLAKEQR